MIHPDKIGMEAKKREDENYKFRSFLKGHADEEELDKQFLRLHKELFADYDCNKCRNCCKMYKGSIPEEDVEKDAEYLDITVEQFIDFFLEKEACGIGYHTKHMPCDFLQEDGNCKLGDCKPDSCKKYPYTDQPERLCSLLGMLDTVAICPVAFEIFRKTGNRSTDSEGDRHMRKEALLEQWKQLYEVATRIKELKPWEKLWDMDLIAVRSGAKEDTCIL
ncbi:MAG: YkgJ family cysteine cluster protein [Enterocloster clostridioformis]